MKRWGSAVAAGLLLLAARAAYAAPPSIPPPADTPYPGVLKVEVDARRSAVGIFDIHESIPVAKAGPVVLLYPSWIPGWHAPEGTIDRLGGLVISAGGKTIAWRRDPVDMFAFHIDAPAGDLDIKFQFLSPPSEKSGSVLTDPDITIFEWNSLLFYPAGHAARRIQVTPSVTLPEGYKIAGPLEVASSAGATTAYKTTDLETLVDSTLFSGRYFKSFDLTPGDKAPVRLNVFVDDPSKLPSDPARIKEQTSLVKQAYALFGSHHFDHYDFLLALSDTISRQGIEHHRSSENMTYADYFSDWDGSMGERDLTSHEFVHSWNGKFRRGADLLTPQYNVPMQNSLLWVYEGQTELWGLVLAARSGLSSRDQTQDWFAYQAAYYDQQPGRSWRPLQDTVNEEIISRRAGEPWDSQQRSEDYYDEGALVWLDVDGLIREKSGEKKSLDDFAKAFFGVKDGSWTPEPYTFEDVVKTLDAIQPYDWRAYLRGRLDSVGQSPIDGIKRAGWRLAYTEAENAWMKSRDGIRKTQNLWFSIGLVLGEKGAVNDVLWDGPAFKAGLSTADEVVAVNGESYSADGLKAAVKATKSGKALLLLVKQGERYRNVTINWRGGLLYPHLERLQGTPDRLGQLLAPK